MIFEKDFRQVLLDFVWNGEKTGLFQGKFDNIIFLLNYFSIERNPIDGISIGWKKRDTEGSILR